jgi:hypothetical protein
VRADSGFFASIEDCAPRPTLNTLTHAAVKTLYKLYFPEIAPDRGGDFLASCLDFPACDEPEWHPTSNATVIPLSPEAAVSCHPNRADEFIAACR